MNGKYCVRPSWHPRQPIRLPPALPKPRRNQASDSSHPRRDACKLLLLTPPQYRPQVPPQVGPMFTNLLTTKQTRHRHIYILPIVLPIVLPIALPIVLPIAYCLLVPPCAFRPKPKQPSRPGPGPSLLAQARAAICESHDVVGATLLCRKH